MSAVRQMVGLGGEWDEAREWICLGGYTALRAISGPLPVSPQPSALTSFLPARVDLSNSLLPEERTKERRRQQKKDCLPLCSFLSSYVIPLHISNPLLGAIFHHGVPCVYYPIQNTSYWYNKGCQKHLALGACVWYGRWYMCAEPAWRKKWNLLFLLPQYLPVKLPHFISSII